MFWKKYFQRAVLAFVAFLVVLFVAGSIVIHTAAFNRFLEGKIIELADQKTSGRLSIGQMTIHWTRLEVDFSNLVLRTFPSADPPFFACGRLRVSAKIVSIWQHKVALRDLVLDRPVFHIVMNSEGRSNLPHSQTPTSATTASTVNAVFNLAIRHLDLNSGEFDYNEEKVPVSVDLRDLLAKVQFDTAAQTYGGSLSYDRGRIDAKDWTPFEHSAQMTFDANRSTFNIQSLSISTGDTRMLVRASLTDYSHPRVQGTYQGTIFTTDLARVLHSPSIPAGHVQTSGSLAYVADPDRPFLNLVSLVGRLSAPTLDVHADGIYAVPERVSANYALQGGNLRVDNVVADVLGGSLNGSFSMSDLAAPHSSSRVDASIRDASLSEMTRVVPASERQNVRLAGSVNASVQAVWSGTPRDAVAHLRADVHGPLGQEVSRQTTIPINGSVDMRYDGLRDTAAFAPSALRTANTQVSVNGVLSVHSSLSVQAGTRDLHELMQLVSAVRASNPSRTSQNSKMPDLHGSANFDGRVMGSPANPRIQGHVTGNDLVVEKTAWRTIQADVDLSFSSVAVQNANLRGADRSEFMLNARLGLQDWSFTPSSPIALEADATAISLTDLQRIANRDYPISGILAAKISIHGSENNPAGQASLGISKGSAWGEPIEKLSLRLQGDGNSVHASAQVQIPAGPISADVTYAPKSQEYDARLSASQLNLAQLPPPRSHGLSVTGIASISAAGKGTIRQPQFSAQLEIPQLQIDQQSISQVRAQLNLANQHAQFTLNSSVLNGYAQAKGDMSLRDGYFTNAAVDVRALPLGPLLATYLPHAPQGLEGQTELHATLSGPLKQPAQIKAQVQIPSLNISYQSMVFGLAEPMRIAYANGLLSVEKAEMKGKDTQLSVHGTIPVKSTQPLNLSAEGSLDLGLLQSFDTQIKTSGQIKLNVTARGAVSRPTTSGEIQIANATFLSDSFPLSLEGLNGQIGLAGDRLVINQLSGTAGGGQISATGFFVYGTQPSFNLSAQAKSVRIRYPEGIRSVLDANLDLTGSPAKSELSGRVLVDRLSFTERFDMANLIGQFNAATPSTAPPAFEQNMKLNVSVITTQNVSLASSKLSVGGSANLNVTGSLTDPVILGRVSLTQGEIFFMGKRYDLQSGTIEFANPVRTEPVLNIYAKTTVQQYNITLNFVGPVDRLRTNYTSTPPLSQADIINLIAFGQTTEQAASSPSTPATLGAESVLAQGIAGQFSGKLEKLAGISQISIDPLASNSQANPAAQLAIQERISGSLLLTFSTDVTSTQAQTVEVQYTPNKKWTFSVIRDENGGYGLDVRIHKVF